MTADFIFRGRISSAIVGVLALLFFVSSVNAASTTGKLTVTIRGVGYSGVSVELSNGDPAASQEKRTSRQGVVTFNSLVPGTYIVTPRRNHAVFTPETATAVITAGKTKRIRIRAAKMTAKVGMAYCVRCHKSFTPDVYAAWLQGPHGNFNYVNEANQKSAYADFLSSFSYPTDHSKFDGYPNNATLGKNQYCLGCHGQAAGDNKRVAGLPLVRAGGTVDAVNSTQEERPVVGCEACHGGGKKHISAPFGRPVTFAEPSEVQCGQCHNKNFPAAHLTDHPAGAGGNNNPGIYEAYQTSAHADSLQDAIFTSTKKTAVTAVCSKCHSDVGARMYKDNAPAELTGEAAHTNFAAVQCRTCHDSHNPTTLLKAASAATGTATARSAQFNTCTNCHELLNDSDAKATPYHSDHSKAITNNHYDDPATQALEGYNVSRASDSACLNCHNPHNTDLTINKEWAEGPHGELTGDPWSHYDWKSSGRRSCQQCHTTTGFINYITSPSTYNAANNNFSHLTGLQNETLYCNGCHTDSAFNTRKIDSVPFPSGLSATLGDDSNLCMGCHQGRTAKKTVDDRVAAGPAPYTSFNNVHYLAAGATLFGTEVKVGYEYNGKTYVGRNTFSSHGGKLDTCTKCHMRTDASDHPDHGFRPQIADCSGCHAGLTDFHELGGHRAEITALTQRLLPALQAYATNTVGFPIAYATSSPYWFRDTNGNGVKDSSETTGYNKFDAKLLKAAYNYHFEHTEPGSHIHNGKYMRQLLFDSLEDIGGSTAGLVRP